MNSQVGNNLAVFYTHLEFIGLNALQLFTSSTPIHLGFDTLVIVL